MTLAMVDPFTYAAYCQQIGEFAEWMAEYVQRNIINARKGWVAHFTSYHWGEKGPTWKEGVGIRRKFHADLLSNLGNDAELLSIANKIIVDWGGINRPYDVRDVPGIRGALFELHNETSNVQWFSEHLDCLSFTQYPRIASHSKIYETYAPSEWTIYDSRVATAIVCLVHKYWQQEGQTTASHYLRLGFPPGRGRQRPYPSEFPLVGSDKQAALSFVYASWLLRRIAEILSAGQKYGWPPTVDDPERWAPLDAGWAVYSVEMALWMMGENRF